VIANVLDFTKLKAGKLTLAADVMVRFPSLTHRARPPPPLHAQCNGSHTVHALPAIARSVQWLTHRARPPPPLHAQCSLTIAALRVRVLQVLDELAAAATLLVRHLVRSTNVRLHWMGLPGARVIGSEFHIKQVRCQPNSARPDAAWWHVTRLERSLERTLGWAGLARARCF
jgi:hypothetical protein